ncbi:uncharacterized protein LOC133825115 [Humulus lupulus]|uniref:uncharacterized protein LOC133825115 n=1 Tax=Humulus lupulus TaxID=3486 RepID=UPI002B417EC2|nr:uncharacterized protein LOC133825115 [Humulus lupulus]
MNVAQASCSNGLVDEQCQYVNKNYNFRPYNNFPAHYHPTLRNHEIFSYANNRNILQPPQEPPRQMGEKPSPSLEKLLKTYIVDSKARLDQHDTHLTNIETHCTNMGAMMKKLETQVGQLANTMKNQISRYFPSDTEKNPKERNAITLRSEKELDAITVEKKKVDEIPMNGEKEEDKKKEEIPKKESLVANLGSIIVPDNQPKIITPLPFPQRFHKKAIVEQFAMFLNIFKKIHTKIPFVDALEQMPNYAEFMKEVMSKMRKLKDYEIMKLAEECTVIIERQLLEMLKDPCSFTIPCVIGELHIGKALCDLGTSINLMPLSIFQKLNLGGVKPTTISLQLADRSLTYHRGIIEDVLEDQEIPIILARPFLATGKALIDVHDGNLTLRVNGKEVKFNISDAMKFPKEQADCKRVDVVTPCLRDFFKTIFHNDPLELCLTMPISKDDLGVDLGMNDVEVVDSGFALEALPTEKEVSKKEDINKAPTLYNSSKKKNSTSDGLVLKQLPAHLRYAFFGDRSTKPIIISASFIEEDERKLLETLKRYSSTFSWSISYIKGISPGICMHKILMEDSDKPSIDHQ